MKKQYDYVVYIGRFQPFHYGHVECITKALELADNVIVLVGSSYAARNVRNPFSYQERKDMIEGYGFSGGRVHIRPIRDYMYNDEPWIAEVQGRVEEVIDRYQDANPKIAILGHERDSTSYYLSVFPQWDRIEVEEHSNINATDIRKALYEDEALRAEYMPFSTCDIVNGLLPIFTELREEWEFLKDYRKQFEGLKYPPIFVTTDAVVLCKGHVLLVKRKAQPGKGLWAIPGGFLRGEERIADGTLRELIEETKIKVPKKVLAGSKTKEKVFDAPVRSLRGRTITHASLYELKNEEHLPAIKGSDDAEKARWFPLADFLKMEEQMYEDHFHIVCTILGINNYNF